MTESSREEGKNRENQNCREDREEKQHIEQTAFKLPKNIRQMGKPGQKYKFYIEDYAYTYLHTFLKERHLEDTLQAAVLLGRYEVYDGCEYTFISKAAVCDFSVFYEGGESQVQEIIRENFPGEQIAGWYVRCNGQDSHVQSIIKHYYAQGGHARHLVFIYEDELEGEFSVSVWEQNGLRSLDGYYIYYERNPLMQEFLIRQKNGQVSSDNIRPRGETVRRYLPEEGKREQKEVFEGDLQMEEEGKKRPQKAVYAACAAVLIIAAATGIAQMGNYQGLKSFQKTIQTISGTLLNEEQNQDDTKEQDKQEENKQTEQNNVEEEGEEQNEATQKESTDEKDSPAEQIEEDIQKEQTEKEEQSDVSVQEEKTKESNEGDSDQKSDTAAETSAQKALDQGYYVVQKGDSLLSISRKLYQTDAMVDKICAANGIQNLDVIYEGQKLKLP